MLKRRFIAGAKCPRCQALDSIVMLTSVDDEWIECIDCQYSEQRPTEIEATTTIETDTVGVVQFKPMTVK